MKIEDLKPGMYEISKDVVNPKADRRKSDRDFASQKEWLKGKRVCVTKEASDSPLHPDRFTICRPGGYTHLGVTGRNGGTYNHPGFDALIAALRPVEWTDHEWVEVHINNGNWILELLLKSGKITRDDILGVVE